MKMPMAIPSIPPSAFVPSDMPSSQDPKSAFMLGPSGLHRRPRDFSALCQKAFDRQRSRAPQDEGRKTGEVKKIGFEAGRPELRAGGRNSLELDRTEPVGQMHGEDGNQQNRRHRYAASGNNAPERTARPPTISTKIVSHPMRYGAGTPIA